MFHKKSNDEKLQALVESSRLLVAQMHRLNDSLEECVRMNRALTELLAKHKKDRGTTNG